MSWRDHMTRSEALLIADAEHEVAARKRAFHRANLADRTRIARIRNTCVQRAKRATQPNKESGS